MHWQEHGWIRLVGLVFLGVLSAGRGAMGDDAPPETAPEPPRTVPARTFNIVKQTPNPSEFATDAQIGEAIEKAASFLMGQFQNSKLKDFNASDCLHGAGADALAVYALLQAGLAIEKPEHPENEPKKADLVKQLDIEHGDFIKGLVEAMKGMDPELKNTYSRGIRATALALINRPEDRGTLISDVNYLLDACNGGAYTYEMNPGRTGSWRTHEYTKGKPFGDNSNSQYGLLGIWSAAEVGAEVSADYWTTVEKHWTTCQAVNGQWDYYTRPAAPAGIPTMTAAGLASLLVCHDYIDAPSGTVVGREPFTPAIAKGLAWLETGKNSYYVPGYASYALERVGLASGFKYFGANDWYRDGATRLINMQQADGSWNERTTVIGTAFNLLFLARGRHALLMSKLRFDHYWCNRPRDLANLCKFTGHELENVFNWQVVSTEHDWTDWLDAPVLYIASHEAPKLKDADFANIRSYVEAGGLLFTHQDGDSTAFNSFVEQVLLKKTFPNYEFTKVPQTHDLYSLGEKDFKAKPLLQMVSNGARALWIHSPADLSAAWQMNAQTSKKDAFNVGLNLFMYSAGKKNFLNRVHSNFISAPPAAAAANNIKVARVKYAVPTWDPEPYAWKRFGNWLGWETSLGISTQAVEMADLGGLAPADVPLAHLTGTNQYTITDAQAQSLAKYVEAGGILLIDSCGGTNFNGSIEKLIAKAFPDTHGKKLTPAHPLLSASADGMSDLSKLELRPYAQNRLGKKGGTLYELNVGKGHVIYTHLDLTNGLLGSRTWGIVGFDTTTSLQLLKNILLWSARGAPENQQ